MDHTIEHPFQKTNIKGVNKAVLVTGGAGYVGSHTCKLLAKNGYVPVVVDRHYNEGLKSFGPNYNLQLPQEIDRLDEIVTRYNITSCIHFAGSTSVPESVSNPSLYYKNNLIATISLLDKLISLNIKTFVYSSSAAVYGDPGMKKCKESDTPQPISSYGASKLMMEQVCKDYKVAYGLSSVGLRYFNAAGADPEEEVGELRQKPTHIIPLAINASRQGKTFSMFGDQYDTEDGTCVRDYMHVSDLSIAHVKALEYLKEKSKSVILNCGYGKGYSVLEILRIFKRIKKNLKIIFVQRRKGDVAAVYSDTKKFRKTIKMKIKYNNIRKILKSSIKWEKILKNRK